MERKIMSGLKKYILTGLTAGQTLDKERLVTVKGQQKTLSKMKSKEKRDQTQNKTKRKKTTSIS